MLYLFRGIPKNNIRRYLLHYPNQVKSPFNNVCFASNRPVKKKLSKANSKEKGHDKSGAIKKKSHSSFTNRKKFVSSKQSIASKFIKKSVADLMKEKGQNVCTLFANKFGLPNLETLNGVKNLFKENRKQPIKRKKISKEGVTKSKDNYKNNEDKDTTKIVNNNKQNIILKKRINPVQRSTSSPSIMAKAVPSYKPVKKTLEKRNPKIEYNFKKLAEKYNKNSEKSNKKGSTKSVKLTVEKKPPKIQTPAKEKGLTSFQQLEKKKKVALDIIREVKHTTALKKRKLTINNKAISLHDNADDSLDLKLVGIIKEKEPIVNLPLEPTFNNELQLPVINFKNTWFATEMYPQSKEIESIKELILPILLNIRIPTPNFEDVHLNALENQNSVQRFLKIIRNIHEVSLKRQVSWPINFSSDETFNEIIQNHPDFKLFINQKCAEALEYFISKELKKVKQFPTDLDFTGSDILKDYNNYSHVIKLKDHFNLNNLFDQETVCQTGKALMQQQIRPISSSKVHREITDDQKPGAKNKENKSLDPNKPKTPLKSESGKKELIDNAKYSKSLEMLKRKIENFRTTEMNKSPLKTTNNESLIKPDKTVKIIMVNAQQNLKSKDSAEKNSKILPKETKSFDSSQRMTSQSTHYSIANKSTSKQDQTDNALQKYIKKLENDPLSTARVAVAPKGKNEVAVNDNRVIGSTSYAKKSGLEPKTPEKVIAVTDVINPPKQEVKQIKTTPSNLSGFLAETKDASSKKEIQLDPRSNETLVKADKANASANQSLSTEMVKADAQRNLVKQISNEPKSDLTDKANSSLEVLLTEKKLKEPIIDDPKNLVTFKDHAQHTSKESKITGNLTDKTISSSNKVLPIEEKSKELLTDNPKNSVTFTEHAKHILKESKSTSDLTEKTTFLNKVLPKEHKKGDPKNLATFKDQVKPISKASKSAGDLAEKVKSSSKVLLKENNVMGNSSSNNILTTNKGSKESKKLIMSKDHVSKESKSTGDHIEKLNAIMKKVHSKEEKLKEHKTDVPKKLVTFQDHIAHTSKESKSTADVTINLKATTKKAPSKEKKDALKKLVTFKDHVKHISKESKSTSDLAEKVKPSTEVLPKEKNLNEHKNEKPKSLVTFKDHIKHISKQSKSTSDIAEKVNSLTKENKLKEHKTDESKKFVTFQDHINSIAKESKSTGDLAERLKSSTKVLSKEKNLKEHKIEVPKNLVSFKDYVKHTSKLSKSSENSKKVQSKKYEMDYPKNLVTFQDYVSNISQKKRASRLQNLLNSKNINSFQEAILLLKDDGQSQYEKVSLADIKGRNEKTQQLSTEEMVESSKSLSSTQTAKELGQKANDGSHFPKPLKKFTISKKEEGPHSTKGVKLSTDGVTKEGKDRIPNIEYAQKRNENSKTEDISTKRISLSPRGDSQNEIRKSLPKEVIISKESKQEILNKINQFKNRKLEEMLGSSGRESLKRRPEEKVNTTENKASDKTSAVSQNKEGQPKINETTQNKDKILKTVFGGTGYIPNEPLDITKEEVILETESTQNSKQDTLKKVQSESKSVVEKVDSSVTDAEIRVPEKVTKGGSTGIKQSKDKPNNIDGTTQNIDRKLEKGLTSSNEQIKTTQSKEKKLTEPNISESESKVEAINKYQKYLSTLKAEEKRGDVANAIKDIRQILVPNRSNLSEKSTTESKVEQNKDDDRTEDSQLRIAKKFLEAQKLKSNEVKKEKSLRPANIVTVFSNSKKPADKTAQSKKPVVLKDQLNATPLKENISDTNNSNGVKISPELIKLKISKFRLYKEQPIKKVIPKKEEESKVQKKQTKEYDLRVSEIYNARLKRIKKLSKENSYFRKNIKEKIPNPVRHLKSLAKYTVGVTAPSTDIYHKKAQEIIKKLIELRKKKVEGETKQEEVVEPTPMPEPIQPPISTAVQPSPTIEKTITLTSGRKIPAASENIRQKECSYAIYKKALSKKIKNTKSNTKKKPKMMSWVKQAEPKKQSLLIEDVLIHMKGRLPKNMTSTSKNTSSHENSPAKGNKSPESRQKTEKYPHKVYSKMSQIKRELSRQENLENNRNAKRPDEASRNNIRTSKSKEASVQSTAQTSSEREYLSYSDFLNKYYSQYDFIKY